MCAMPNMAVFCSFVIIIIIITIIIIIIESMLNLCELFPETTGFMTVMLGQVTGIHNDKKCILDTNNNNNNNNNNNETCRKCRQKPETSQHIATACRSLTQGEYNLLSPPGFQPQTVHPVASPHTNYAIPPKYM